MPSREEGRRITIAKNPFVQLTELTIVFSKQEMLYIPTSTTKKRNEIAQRKMSKESELYVLGAGLANSCMRFVRRSGVYLEFLFRHQLSELPERRSDR